MGGLRRVRPLVAGHHVVPTRLDPLAGHGTSGAVGAAACLLGRAINVKYRRAADHICRNARAVGLYGRVNVVKGPAEQLLGDTGFQMQVILVFPTKELATGWYHSPEYRALAPVRDAGMRAQFQLTGA